MDVTGTIEHLRQLLSERDDVLTAYLFGSSVKGAVTPRDVDVAVVLDGPTKARTVDQLAVELEAAVGATVDLHVLGELPVDLQYRVVQEGTVLVERDPAQRVRDEIRVMHAHHDFLPHLDLIRRANRARLAATRG